jgi:hypothetical protein
MVDEKNLARDRSPAPRCLPPQPPCVSGPLAVSLPGQSALAHIRLAFRETILGQPRSNPETEAA